MAANNISNDVTSSRDMISAHDAVWVKIVQDIKGRSTDTHRRTCGSKYNTTSCGSAKLESEFSCTYAVQCTYSLSELSAWGKHTTAQKILRMCGLLKKV